MAAQMVSYTSNGEQSEAYLAVAPSGRGAGVVVIHDQLGLVPHIRDVADRLSREGYTALAPDLYHGRTASGSDEASQLMSSLNVEEAVSALAAACDHLRTHAGTTDKLGTVGFSMGGGLSLVTATMRPIDACVIYYAALPDRAQPDLSDLAGPVMGHYGEEDDLVPPHSAHDLEDRIHAAGKHAQFLLYEGVGHGFFNDSHGHGYDEEAAMTSWARTLAFYHQHLR